MRPAMGNALWPWRRRKQGLAQSWTSTLVLCSVVFLALTVAAEHPAGAFASSRRQRSSAISSGKGRTFFPQQGSLVTPKRRTLRHSDQPAAVLSSSPKTEQVLGYRGGEQAQVGTSHRSLIDGTASGTTASLASMFWWDNADNSYVQAGELCSTYGGTLAVLAPSPEVPANLLQGVEYWVGLFNAAQLPWAWTWVDQTKYINSTALWDQGQPDSNSDDSNNWCVYISWSAAANAWRWSAGDCAKQRAVLCQLPSTGSVTSQQSFSCAQGMSLSTGAVIQTTSLTDTDTSQHPQQCAALCRKRADCAGFRLTGAVCRLQSQTSKAPTGTLTLDTDIRVSCLRYGLDFVNLGNTVAAQVLSEPQGSNDYKCLTDYRVNLVVAQTNTGMCSASQCADLCATTTWGNNTCTAFLHSSSRCRCQLGYSPLRGSDADTGLMPGAGYSICMRNDKDWLLFGALNDPSLVVATLGSKTYTLHPERLSYDAAASVCRTQSLSGTLTSLSSLSEMLLVAGRLLLSQPPRLLTPVAGVDASMYGTWVGLAGDGSQLRGVLDKALGVTTQGLGWDDQEPVNRTMLQVLWSVFPNGTLLAEPDVTASWVCVYLSNSTAAVRPGLAAADACSWELPFVCESTLSESPPPPPPSPPAVSAAGSGTRSNPVVVALAVDVAALPLNDAVQPPPDINTSVVAGQPAILTVPDTGVLMWLAPSGSAPVSQDEADSWCGMWNASLATVYNQTAEALLTSAADPLGTPYWINLFVNQSTMQWEWGRPNTRQNSSDFLSKFTSWCTPDGEYWNDGDPAVPAPPVDAGYDCAQMTFNVDRCPDNGWGWMAQNCSDPASYMCMAAPRGTPGYYYCADHYGLAGRVVNRTNFGGVTLAQAASYCSDLCTRETACHAFIIVNGTCIRLSRNATSLSLDVVSASVTVGCFKYGLLWDMLGGEVAVQTRVAKDANSRYRCIRYQVVYDGKCWLLSCVVQDVTRVNLQTLKINSCLLSDCTAQCFVTRSCEVAVFNHNTCMCTLGRNALAGQDGTNGFRDGITTCIYDDQAAFLGIGLARSAAYIAPPVAGAPAAGSSGDWLGGGGSNPNQDSGTIDDINFVPGGSTAGQPPATNPSNPQANSPPTTVPTPSPPPPSPTQPPPDSGSVATSPAPVVAFPPPPLQQSPLESPPPPPPTSVRGLSPPVIGAYQPQESGSKFGVPQMIGITAGFCGSVLLLLGATAFIIVRRRKAAAAEALAGKGKQGGGGSFPADGASGPRIDGQRVATALRTSGLSADTQRALITYVETCHSASLPDSPAQRMNTATLTHAQAQELQAALQKEHSGEGCLDPETLSALEQILQNVQQTSSGSNRNTAGSQGRNAPSNLQAGNSVPDATRSHVQSSTSQPPFTTAVSSSGAVTAMGEPCGTLVSKSGICSSYITLARLLGAGSFGTVYEGVWRRQTVAVKIIPHSPAAAQRVKNEVELSMQFDHANVVKSFFYETFDSRAMHQMAQMEAKTAQRESQETWIVLEFCSEGSLASRLYSHAHNNHNANGENGDNSAVVDEVPAPRPMHERDPCIASLEGILNIALGVAQGMAYMHSLAICHGDLKCENVLLASPFGGGGAPPSQVVAKVGDFGLSRAMGDISSHLSTATVGTVTHMPPELLLSGRLRPSCDVYSFGIMLWQLYTGAVPYAGMRYAEIVYKVAVCNLRPLFPIDTPRVFRELAQACWHSDAASRPTFEQVIMALKQMLDMVGVLESERRIVLDSLELGNNLTSPGRTSTLSDPAADITLLSPWIHACPNPGSSGMPHTPPSAQLAAWAADLLGPHAPVPAGPTPATTTAAATTPNTLSPMQTARDSTMLAAVQHLHDLQPSHSVAITTPMYSMQESLATPTPSLPAALQTRSSAASSTSYSISNPTYLRESPRAQGPAGVSALQASSPPRASDPGVQPLHTPGRCSLLLPPPPSARPQCASPPRDVPGAAHHASRSGWATAPSHTSPRDSASIYLEPVDSHPDPAGAPVNTILPPQHQHSVCEVSSASAWEVTCSSYGSFQSSPHTSYSIHATSGLSRPVQQQQQQRTPPGRHCSFNMQEPSAGSGPLPFVGSPLPTSQPLLPPPPVLQQRATIPTTGHRPPSSRSVTVLPGGSETHVTLRATATSQIVMGAHGASLASRQSSLHSGQLSQAIPVSSQHTPSAGWPSSTDSSTL